MARTHATADEAIRKAAAVLPSLHAPALALMRGRKSSPISVYLSLLQDAAALDLGSDGALPFRTRFNGFYGVRRNEVWRNTFYHHFEAAKRSPRLPSDLFEERLRAVHEATGRVEASFVSKAIATLHPANPIIDKVLRDRFANLVIPPPFGGGLDEALNYYRWLSEVMAGLASTREAATWFAVYDAAFSDIPGAASVHPVKKLDFLIWAGRPTRPPSPQPLARPVRTRPPQR